MQREVRARRRRMPGERGEVSEVALEVGEKSEQGSTCVLSHARRLF